MKRILTVLMFVAVFGMLCGSVVAADMHEYDFDGKFTLEVPSDDFDRHPVGTNTFNDKNNNLKIEYFTMEEINNKNCENFDVYIDECLRLDEVESDGDMTVFQDGDEYVVTVQSEDVLVIITSNDLEKAKTVAKTADFGDNADKTPSQNNSTTEASNNSSDVEMERVSINEYMTIEAPKGCEFDNGTYDGFWVTYYGSKFDGIVYYTNDDSAQVTIDDAYYDEFIKNITSHEGIKSYVDGDVTIVEGIQNIDGTNAGYVHGDNEMAIVISDDLNLVKKMAKTVEFTK
ncbi:hypothetical protein [Methanobrevibacter sp.]